MSVLSPRLASFLGSRASQVVAKLPEGPLRNQALEAIGACAQVLSVVDRLDMSDQDLADPDEPGERLWSHISPAVQGIVEAVLIAITELRSIFPYDPSTEDEGSPGADDIVFDEVGGSGLQVPVRDKRDEEIDAIVRDAGKKKEEVFGRSVISLASMVEADLRGMALSLRNPQVLADRWLIISLVEEIRGKCSQCFEAVVATILTSLTEEELEDVLPRYSSASARAVQLRSAIIDLEHGVSELNRRTQALADAELPAVWRELRELFGNFSSGLTYRWVRSQDKRELVRFRVFLTRWGGSGPALELRQQLEGISKFLELMRGINRRRVLVLHDREAVKTVRKVLEFGLPVEEALSDLETLYGRSHSLDRMIRSLREGAQVEGEALTKALDEASDLTEMMA